MKRISVANEGGNQRSSSSSPRPLLTSGQLAVRLGLAFSVIVVVMIAAGDLGLRQLAQINYDLRDVMGRQWTKLRLSREAAAYSSRNSRITMEIFLTTDKVQIDALMAERKENTNRITTLLSELEQQCESDEERKSLAEVMRARKIYVDGYLRALHVLLVKKNRPAAVALMGQENTPALVKYQAAWDDFMRFEGDQLERAERRSVARYVLARRRASVMSVFAVLIAGVTAMLVLRRMLREITDRLRDEKDALRAAHQEAEVFINAVPSILIGVDRGSRITRWNSAASSAFDLSGAEAVGKQLANCGVKWQRPGMQSEIESWGSEGKSRRCDRVPFEIRGETRLLGLTITPTHVVGENVTEILVIGSDITDRSVLEDQIRQAQKLESVGQLAAGIAHEINTPTQYIGDNVQFLKEAFQDLKSLLASYGRLLAAVKGSTLSGEAQEVATELEQTDAVYLLEEIPKAIDQSLEGITRVSTLVSAMKEFSHPGTKEKILLDLNHAIQSTITVARNEWKYVADMETDFDATLPLVCCQPGEFNQVILNLIVNAAHAIAGVVGKGGTQKGKIRVQTRNFPECAEIRVQDTGTGIPEKARARIFDPFFTTKEIGKGTGQGLAIAHSVVVDKHEGTIRFETEEGKGTTFIIRLPHAGKTLAAKAVSA